MLYYANQIYSVRDNDRKTIVIDGQQRLTSLWIAVYGSYTSEKGKNKMYHQQRTTNDVVFVA